jgi:hypothetical protein
MASKHLVAPSLSKKSLALRITSMEPDKVEDVELTESQLQLNKDELWGMMKVKLIKFINSMRILP